MTLEPSPTHPRSELILAAVQAALREDIGPGDATTEATIPHGLLARARLVAREPALLCGGAWAECAFLHCDPGARIQHLARDGDRLSSGACAMEIDGLAGPMLTAERTALNFIQRLSGVATLTARYVKAVEGTQAQILDTRKTTPGWRVFEKYAVRCGGGKNHRAGLYDRILIKDNHRVALASEPGGAITAAVRRARACHPELLVEVEADHLGEVRQALDAGADMILLDNMPPGTLRKAVELARGRALTEASGGVNLSNVRQVAETGVDFISVGALTHSAPAVDFALDFLTWT